METGEEGTHAWFQGAVQPSHSAQSPQLALNPPRGRTHQQGEAVLRQHPVLSHEPLSGHSGQLGEPLPQLVHVDHLLWVCAGGEGAGVVEQQRGQVGLWHEPGGREETA